MSLVNETRNESTGIVFGFHLRSIMWSRVSTGRVYLLLVLCIDKTFIEKVIVVVAVLVVTGIICRLFAAHLKLLVCSGD